MIAEQTTVRVLPMYAWFYSYLRRSPYFMGFWTMTPCVLVITYLRFEGNCRLQRYARPWGRRQHTTSKLCCQCNVKDAQVHKTIIWALPSWKLSVYIPSLTSVTDIVQNFSLPSHCDWYLSLVPC